MNDERLTRRLRDRLAEAGLTGSFLVRDLATGQEIGIDPETELPIASLVKVPLAMVVLDRIRAGLLDGADTLDIRPDERATPSNASSVGLARFRHRARIAVDDLLYLALAISDNVATDALFGLVPPVQVHDALRELGFTGISVRHAMSALEGSPADRLAPNQLHLAHLLAIGAGTAGRGHPVAQLDITRANTGTARAFVDLLAALWSDPPAGIDAQVAQRTRELMRGNLIAQRLAPDFTSDASTWSSKTGTLLNLRHEVGVVVHENGAALAVAALAESSVPAASQPAAEALMGEVARALHDHLRAP